MTKSASEGRWTGEVAPATALFVAGFAALSIQVLLMRELLVAWRGNEMSLGISLSVWLASNGAGALLYAHLAPLVRRFRDPSEARGPAAEPRTDLALGSLARFLTVLGVLAPTALVIVRLTRLVLGMPAGELTGLSGLLTGALVSVAPFALLGGFFFALTVSTLAALGGGGARAVGNAYVIESAGAVAAGALMSFVFLRRLDPMSTAFLATALCSGAAMFLIAADGARRRHALVCGVILAAALAAVLSPLGGALDDLTVAWQWNELGFRSQANSIYGRIITTQIGSQKSVYESGVLSASHPDRLSAEEIAHIPMLQHPSPERVLLVGGCLGGTVAEILKHPSVRSIDCVELDPMLIEEASRQFGASMTAGLADPRVNLSYGDARFLVKRAAEEHVRRYDVAIVSVPDPTTARLNRFYTLEFARELRSCLAAGGVAGLSLSSAENYVSEELAELLASVEGTFDVPFEEVLLTPGDPCHVLAGAEGSYLSADPETLSARVRRRALDLAYIRGYYLRDRLSEERRSYLGSALSAAEARPNTDLTPRGYFLSLLLWDRQLYAGRGLLSAARSFVSLRAALIAAAVIAVIGVLPAAGRRGPPAAVRTSVMLSVFVVGLTEISLEIAALVGFQSLYGYV
ncbi:MAG: hypothetical protein GF400_02750, partial [Candidatus Eisenbacteria bacterium]|nr:hypothetical protein [Candidatus Eisenbacteria bacterium]